MKVEVISVGSELVSGQVRDLNAPYIASRLTGLDFDVVHQTIVGDDFLGLKRSLQTVSERTGLIVITGGLGPTNDDITRETVADFCNVRLVSDEKSVNHIGNLTKKVHKQKFINSIKQTEIPEGGIVIRNSIGTAQGFLVNAVQPNIICLPGVHTEMALMFEKWVIPYLSRVSAKRNKRYTRVIHIFGITESVLDEKAQKIIKPDQHLSYSTLVNEGIVSIRITLCNTTEIKANAVLDEIEENICGEFGECVFGKGEETPEGVIAKTLKQNTMTLAIAESCTGGLVSNLLTNVEGSSVFFLGGVVCYSNTVKKEILSVPEGLIERYGVISAEVAKAMASGVREYLHADIGLAVTGIAGPAGIDAGVDKCKPVGLVYVATVINENAGCREYNFFGSRIDIKKRAANAALHTLHLCLSGKNL